ncbi:CD225/dispanin family protein [Porphyromonas bennonis]|uniref:CD225/dispanin family protein n=1 Tax=Porphyromonas bennonis TaxID=501496 RepID=UPI0003797112|nr:CD225/dispanin family protein [Porphyromonas bennonis]
MSEYYILNGSEQQGPYTIDQLRGRVTPQTYVWREGLADWVQAINLPELSVVLLPEGSVSPSGVVKPKDYLVESILVTLFCCMVFGILGIVYSVQANSAFSSGNITAANEFSAKAKQWVTYGFWCGIAVVGIYAILALMGALSSISLTAITES